MSTTTGRKAEIEIPDSRKRVGMKSGYVQLGNGARKRFVGPVL